jgi:hypothetical protein
MDICAAEGIRPRDLPHTPETHARRSPNAKKVPLHRADSDPETPKISGAMALYPPHLNKNIVSGIFASFYL